MKLFPFLLVCFFFASKAGLSLPNIDEAGALFSITGENAATTILIPDDEVKGKFYYPLDRIRILKDDDGLAEFSFSYTQQGAVLAFSVAPETAPEELAAAKKKVRETVPNAVFEPISLRKGGYHLTLDVADGQKIIESGAELQGDDLGNPWNLQLALNRDLADLIVVGLSTGAILGINFEYRFEAAATPSTLSVKIAATQTGDRFLQSPFQTDSSLPKLFNELVTKKFIEIRTTGDKPPLQSALLFINSWMRDRCFKRLGDNSVGAPMRYNKDECTSTTLGKTFELESPATLIATASAGFSFGDICGPLKDYVTFSKANGKVGHGCPDRILPPVGQAITLATEPKVLDYKKKDKTPKPLLPGETQ